MLDRLRNLFLQALKFDGKDATPLVLRWNEEIKRIQVMYDSLTSKRPLQEVKHARWKESEGEFRCTNCGAILEEDMRRWHNFYYCYHCGAKMDFEEVITNDRFKEEE